MSTQPHRDWQDDPEAPPPAWEWPTAPRRPQQVIGETELFITSESAAQVANTFGAFETDADQRTLDIKSRAPTVDPAEKWVGTDSSDP